MKITQSDFIVECCSWRRSIRTKDTALNLLLDHIILEHEDLYQKLIKETEKTALLVNLGNGYDNDFNEKWIASWRKNKLSFLRIHILIELEKYLNKQTFTQQEISHDPQCRTKLVTSPKL